MRASFLVRQTRLRTRRPQAARVPRPGHADGHRRGARPGDRTPGGRARRRARSHPRPAAGAGGGARADGRRERRRSPAAPTRRDRQRQDRGVPAGRGCRARAGALRDRARARDRADASDGGAVRRPLRPHGGDPAFAPHRARALRRVDPPALGPGARVRGTAIGRVRAANRPGPDRDRRGARRAPTSRRAIRATTLAMWPSAEPRPPGPPCSWAARPRARRAPTACRTCPSRTALTAAACRRSSWWGWRAFAGPFTNARGDALEAVRRGGEKAIVLLNRRGWSNFLTCGVCGRVWECPRCDVTLVLHRKAAPGVVPSLRPRGAGAGRLPGLRLGVAFASRDRHRAAGRGARRG